MIITFVFIQIIIIIITICLTFMINLINLSIYLSLFNDYHDKEDINEYTKTAFNILTGKTHKKV